MEQQQQCKLEELEALLETMSFAEVGEFFAAEAEAVLKEVEANGAQEQQPAQAEIHPEESRGA